MMKEMQIAESVVMIEKRKRKILRRKGRRRCE